MPHENNDDEISKKSVANVDAAWHEMDWHWFRQFAKRQREAEIRKAAKEALDLNIQAAKLRAKQHPNWRQAVSMVRESPFLALLALAFFPITIALYAYRNHRKSS